jgi:predicted DNA-binding protein with PD1-like motif
MVLRQGDQVLQQLEMLAIREQIPSASFSGFGFVDARFGYFNSKTREYEPKDIRNVEMANMTGTIAWQDGKPSIHAHAVVADKKFKAFGGHLLQATVGTGTVEISITVYVQKLERKKDETLGANILQLP